MVADNVVPRHGELVVGLKDTLQVCKRRIGSPVPVDEISELNREGEVPLVEILDALLQLAKRLPVVPSPPSVLVGVLYVGNDPEREGLLSRAAPDRQRAGAQRDEQA